LSLSIGAFRALIHDAIVEELGDPNFDDSLGEDQGQESECQDMHSHYTEAVVDLDEFPWAIGVTGQQAEPVAQVGRGFINLTDGLIGHTG